MIKRLRMAWCALRGGHHVRFKEWIYIPDILLDCGRCPWSALVVRAGTPAGPSVRFTSIDEAMPTDDRCPVCMAPYVQHRYEAGVYNCPTTWKGQ